MLPKSKPLHRHEMATHSLASTETKPDRLKKFQDLNISFLLRTAKVAFDDAPLGKRATNSLHEHCHNYIVHLSLRKLPPSFSFKDGVATGAEDRLLLVGATNRYAFYYYHHRPQSLKEQHTHIPPIDVRVETSPLRLLGHALTWASHLALFIWHVHPALILIDLC